MITRRADLISINILAITQKQNGVNATLLKNESSLKSYDSRHEPYIP